LHASISLLPRCGLGNKLFVWARGSVFGRMHGLRHYTYNWSHYSWRNWLEFNGEDGAQRRSLYGQSFLSNDLVAKLQLLRLPFSRSVFEPSILAQDRKELVLNDYHYAVFSKLPHWESYFVGLREHRDYLRQQLRCELKSSHRFVDPSKVPAIAVHVRMGDFRPPDETRPFAEQGNTRTSIAYFKEIIGQLREAAGWSVPVTIFSDGKSSELSELLSLGSVERYADSKSDIEELLAMSQAKVIVTSAGSTFSLWAAFLSDAVTIHHPDHFHGQIRSPGQQWEGPWKGIQGEFAESLRQSLGPRL